MNVDKKPLVSLQCVICGGVQRVALAPSCECGGAFETVYDWSRLRGWTPNGADATRYNDLMPVPEALADMSLGEGDTPLIRAADVFLKCEHVNPTGSYKDRIAAVAISIGLADGASGWVGTSSGNAGAAFAAYGARAGLTGTVFAVPTTPPEKLAQMTVFGVDVYPVDKFGSDPEIETAVFSAVRTLADRRRLVLGITARSFNAAAMDGVKPIAYEIVEALGKVPDVVYVPVGGGGLIASIWHGFEDWYRLGLAARTPRMVAVQPAGCAPVHAAAMDGADVVTAVAECTSRISGLQLTAPPDGDQALRAIRASGGFSIAVSDEAAAAAQRTLAREHGVFVEPAAATAYAGYQAAPTDGVVVIVLTGSGLKTTVRNDGDEVAAPISVDSIDGV